MPEAVKCRVSPVNCKGTWVPFSWLCRRKPTALGKTVLKSQAFLSWQLPGCCREEEEQRLTRVPWAAASSVLVLL